MKQFYQKIVKRFFGKNRVIVHFEGSFEIKDPTTKEVIDYLLNIKRIPSEIIPIESGFQLRRR